MKLALHRQKNCSNDCFEKFQFPQTENDVYFSFVQKASPKSNVTHFCSLVNTKFYEI